MFRHHLGTHPFPQRTGVRHQRHLCLQQPFTAFKLSQYPFLQGESHLTMLTLVTLWRFAEDEFPKPSSLASSLSLLLST